MAGLGHVRFTSWNVRGLGGPIKRVKVFSHLKNLKSEIVFLQETHLRICDHTRLRRPLVRQVFHSSFNSRARGTAILVHKRLQFPAEKIVSDPNGRYIIVVGTLFQTPVVLTRVYAPNWDSPSFMTALFSLIPCLNSQMAQAFTALMDQIGCVDAWRYFHPTIKEFSFYSQVHQTNSRIDYCFLDKILLPSVKLCEYSTIVISDHAPLLLDMELIPKCMRHSTWWFDTGLLSSNTFCSFISVRISFFIQTNKSESISPSLLWETFKAVIRGEIISYKAKTNKQRKQKEQDLLEAIRQRDIQHARSPP